MKNVKKEKKKKLTILTDEVGIFTLNPLSLGSIISVWRNPHAIIIISYRGISGNYDIFFNLAVMHETVIHSLSTKVLYSCTLLTIRDWFIQIGSITT